MIAALVSSKLGWRWSSKGGWSVAHYWMPSVLSCCLSSTTACRHPILPLDRLGDWTSPDDGWRKTKVNEDKPVDNSIWSRRTGLRVPLLYLPLGAGEMQGITNTVWDKHRTSSRSWSCYNMNTDIPWDMFWEYCLEWLIYSPQKPLLPFIMRQLRRRKIDCLTGFPQSVILPPMLTLSTNL
jgi:hypothetical protein